MEIRENLTGVNYNARGTWPSWIVIHNTENHTADEGTAYKNTVYFQTYRAASANYFVDDGPVVWCCVRPTDTAWHCGEAPSRNGCYNSNSIGIEVCETDGGSFTENEIATLTELVGWLMQKYGIPAERVVRHHDVTGKDCPRGYIKQTNWDALHARITGGDSMPSAKDLWDYKVNGMSAGERLFLADKQLFDRTDYSGRGKDGSTIVERVCWMAAKQEQQQEQLDRLEKKIDELLKK